MNDVEVSREDIAGSGAKSWSWFYYLRRARTHVELVTLVEELPGGTTPRPLHQLTPLAGRPDDRQVLAEGHHVAVAGDAQEKVSPMPITASFSSATAKLTINGDNLGNAITASRTAAGNIRVNGGAVAISGGTPTVANTSLIEAFGQAGNDIIALDEAGGALPAANLFGGRQRAAGFIERD